MCTKGCLKRLSLNAAYDNLLASKFTLQIASKLSETIYETRLFFKSVHKEVRNCLFV